MQIPSCLTTYFDLNSAIVSTTNHYAHPFLLIAVHRSLPDRALGALAARQSGPARRTELLKFLLRRADLRVPAPRGLERRTPSNLMDLARPHRRGSSSVTLPGRTALFIDEYHTSASRRARQASGSAEVATPHRTNGIDMPERIGSRRSDEKTEASDGCGADGAAGGRRRDGEPVARAPAARADALKPRRARRTPTRCTPGRSRYSAGAAGARSGTCPTLPSTRRKRGPW